MKLKILSEKHEMNITRCYEIMINEKKRMMITVINDLQDF